MDYSKYGIDPNQALPAARAENYLSLEVAALEAELERDSYDRDDDPEGHGFLAERATEAREKAESVRLSQKMTKGEALDARRNLVANELRSKAQQHLQIEARKGDAMADTDRDVLAAEQARIERRIEALEEVYAESI